MMRRSCQRRWVGFCRQQIESMIDLEGIRADDFCAELRRNVSRDLRFSRCRWTDNEKDAAHKNKSGDARFNQRHVSRLKSRAAINRASVRWISRVAAVSKKFDDSLPECFLLRCRRALLLETPAAAPSSRPTTPMALASLLLIRVHDDP